MRNLSEEQRARALHDPLGLKSNANKPTAHVAEAQASGYEISPVNPLWMITAGLATFVVLLVLVW